MASAVNMTDDLQVIGDEWAPRNHTLKVIEDFILPYVHSESVVAEIGVGGGRIAVEVFELVKKLHCYDISKEMISKAQAMIAKQSELKKNTNDTNGKIQDRVVFHHLLSSNTTGKLLGDMEFDFIYS